MTEQNYQTIKDPYCYINSTVLRNKAGYTTQAELDDFEALATASRFALKLP
jgi:hypothetical protein